MSEQMFTNSLNFSLMEEILLILSIKKILIGSEIETLVTFVRRLLNSLNKQNNVEICPTRISPRLVSSRY